MEDEPTRQTLERIRALFADVLPLLAVVESAVEAAELVPEWMTAVARMDSEQLDRIITNLSLVENDG